MLLRCSLLCVVQDLNKPSASSDLLQQTLLSYRVLPAHGASRKIKPNVMLNNFFSVVIFLEDLTVLVSISNYVNLEHDVMILSFPFSLFVFFLTYQAYQKLQRTL